MLEVTEASFINKTIHVTLIHAKQVSLDGTLDSFRIGIFAKESDHVIRRLELSAPPEDIQEKGRGWRLSSVINGQGFNRSCLHNGSDLKTWALESFWVLITSIC